MSTVNLVTGTPGAGKTLWTITHVKELAESEDRPVFYVHIDGLTLPWHELEDPTQWWSLPEGSIIVFDEAHHYFPPEPSSRALKEHVSMIGETRHKGFTIFLITQSQNSVHWFVRERVTRHYFLQRKQGQERATLYQDESLINTRSKRELKEITGQVWSYPKDAYQWYKSAEMHTVKKRLPPGMWRLWVLLPFLGLGVYLVTQLRFFDGYGSDQDHQIGEGETMQETAPGHSGLAFGPTRDTPNPFLVEQLTPLVPGRPWTAPAYSEVVKVKTFPKPNCLRNEKTGACHCYSQQATRMQVPVAICNALIEQGWFDPTRTDEPQPGDARNHAPSPGRVEEGAELNKPYYMKIPQTVWGVHM
jgi:zona occludens toxin